MDRTLFLLRALTLTTSILLAFGLLARIALFRQGATRASRAAWLLIAGVQCTLMVNYGLGELFTVARLWLDSWPILQLGHQFYYAAYLANGVLDALLPAALLVVSLQAGWGRKGSVLLALGIVVVGAIAIGGGALQDWSVLLTAAQLISLLGVAGYLAFCGAFVLKRLPRVDLYMAGYVAVAAAFHLVLPIQEVIFQAVGQVLAGGIWHLNQLLLALRFGTQFAIVLACIKSVRLGLAPSSAYSVRVS